jgi:acetyl esterase/lipase
MMFLNDSVVPFSFLRLCFLHYLPDEFYEQQRFYEAEITPICASDEVISKLPFISFCLCGIVSYSSSYLLVNCLEFDPLLDDSILFIQRLEAVGKPFDLKIYPLIPHAFLSFGVPAFPPFYEAKLDSIDRLLAMFSHGV